MTETILKAGSIVKVNGFPVRLKADVAVESETDVQWYASRGLSIEDWETEDESGQHNAP